MITRYARTSPAYQEALNWLYSFLNSEHKLPESRVEFNLPRTQALLSMLGQPQRSYPSVLIAGTKGKGSTAAMLESLLRAAGMRTGLYTSPHLHSYRERIQINREPIGQERFVALAAELKPIVARLDPQLGPPSVFEVGTALALLHFAREQLEVAVLEIGLGGRFDAVNAVTPQVSLISSISYDHRGVLGDTLAAIAFEKAGIIKPGIPVVSAPQHAEAMEVLVRVAQERGAPLFVAGEAGLARHGYEGCIPYPAPIDAHSVGLLGSVQLDNARLASGAALLLREAGLAIPDAAVADGLKSVRWPARLEVLRERPLVVADGAHNGDSATKLSAALGQLFHYQRLILILGALADKEINAIAAALVPQADELILVRSRHPRSANLEQLQQAVQPYVRGPVETRDDAFPALELALQRANPNDLVCVAGSLAVAAGAREFFGLGEPD